MSATISVLAIYNYDRSIMDGLKLPSGIDRNALLNRFMAETAELECLYPEPATLKTVVSALSTAMSYKWQHLYETVIQKYNPIENYDRQEDWTDTGNATNTVTAFNSNNLEPASGGSSTGRHTGRVHGNIGVTTTAQMLTGERALADFSVYDAIILDLKTNLCIMVY